MILKMHYSPIEWKRPAELQVFPHQFSGGGCRGHSFELLQQSHFRGSRSTVWKPGPGRAFGHVRRKKPNLIFSAKLP